MPHVLALTTPDTIVLVVVGFFALRGAIKGFVWQLLRTAGLVGGLLLGARHNVAVGRFLSERFSAIPSGLSDLIGWIVIVFGIFLAVTLVAHLVRDAVRGVRLTGIDRWLGAGLGGAMGLLFAAVGFSLYASFLTDAEKRDVLGGAVSTAYMARAIETVGPLFPDVIRERWAPVLSALGA